MFRRYFLHRMVAVAALWGLVLTTQASHAYIYEITQLTHGDFNEANPEVSGNNVVWQSYGDGNHQVFLYDGVTTKVIGDNATWSSDVAIDGDRVAWRGTTPGESHVYMYDGATTRQISIESGLTLTDADIFVSGDNVAWLQGMEEGTVVYFHDGTTTKRISDQQADRDYLAMSGDRVVWSNFTGNVYTTQLYLYDDATGENVPIGGTGAKDPVMSGDYIAWRDSEGNGNDIFLYDGQNTINIGSVANDYYPHLDGEHVAWQKKFGGSIYHYDGSSTERIDPSNHVNAWGARVSGDKVVWQAKNSSGYDIFVYDGADVTRLTNNNRYKRDVRISGDNIVWQGQDYDGNYNVFLATPADTNSNASFALDEDIDTLDLNFGLRTLGGDEGPVPFQIANLDSAGYVARLDLNGIFATGDSGVLTTDLAVERIQDMVAGGALDLNAVIDTSSLGHYQSQYRLTFTDVLGGLQTLRLNLRGTVVANDAATPNLIYNAATGEVVLDPDGATGIIGYTLKSFSDAFLPGEHVPNFDGVLTSSSGEIAEAALASVATPISIGAILPAGLDLTGLLNVMDEFQVRVSYSEPAVPFDLIVVDSTSAVPEPSTYAMAAVGLLGLAGLVLKRRGSWRRRGC